MKIKINYFSDLFVGVMVVGWILVIILEAAAAIYSTVVYENTDIWSNLTELVGVPLSCGGAIWMVKNSVQHYLANKRGEPAPMDFPKVDDTEIELEEEMEVSATMSDDQCG